MAKQGTYQAVCPSVYLVGGSELSDGHDCLVYIIDLGELVLIDCGSGPGWPYIRENIRAASLDPDKIHTLILTHGHIDHIGATEQVVDETGCRVVAHSLDCPYIESGDPGFTASSIYGIELRGISVDHVVTGDEEVLAFPNGEIRLIHTPGHTPGSMVALLDTGNERVLFGQDIHGPFFPAFKSDIEAWKRSMQVLIELKADILCEGHFGIFSPAEKVREFIQGHLDYHR